MSWCNKYEVVHLWCIRNYTNIVAVSDVLILNKIYVFYSKNVINFEKCAIF